jgi:hypothetical protein
MRVRDLAEKKSEDLNALDKRTRRFTGIIRFKSLRDRPTPLIDRATNQRSPVTFCRARPLL